ncbi:uncharacterized protein LOC142330357 [Lycorma delicatula]|uniref:uncharacterized protein LOC142330357 n=1 Tax=Lycorma delicatula TaxID=130591 RepID=UPI003F5111E7
MAIKVKRKSHNLKDNFNDENDHLKKLKTEETLDENEINDNDNDNKKLMKQSKKKFKKDVQKNDSINEKKKKKKDNSAEIQEESNDSDLDDESGAYDESSSEILKGIGVIDKSGKIRKSRFGVKKTTKPNWLEFKKKKKELKKTRREQCNPQ